MLTYLNTQTQKITPHKIYMYHAVDTSPLLLNCRIFNCQDSQYFLNLLKPNLET